MMTRGGQTPVKEKFTVNSFRGSKRPDSLQAEHLALVRQQMLE